MPVSDPTLKTPAQREAEKAQAIADLPPPGDARRDALMQRLDKLNQEAEEIAAKLGIERIDPAKFIPDHDAQVAAAKLGIGIAEDAEVGIKGMRRDRAYVCVWADPYNRLANRIFYQYKKEGWEVVGPGMEEWDANAEAQQGGMLRYADTLLMWMPRERHDELKRKQLALRIAREEGVPLRLLELADKAGVKASYGDLPTDGGPDSIAAQALRASQQLNSPRGALALQIAQKKFQDALKAGTLHRR